MSVCATTHALKNITCAITIAVSDIAYSDAPSYYSAKHIAQSRNANNISMLYSRDLDYQGSSNFGSGGKTCSMWS